MITSRSTKKTIQLIFLLSLALLLGSCQNNEDSTCDSVAETAGEPDLTGTASFTPTTLVRADTTVTVDVPVDGETLEGTVYLLPVGKQNTGTTDVISSNTFTSAAGVAETVPVTLTFSNPLVDTYYPAVVLCDAVGACTKGAGYVEDISGLLADTGNYVRGNLKGDGTVNLSSLIDSCVPITTVNVN